ncbi:MAG: hypothetical protein IPK56_09735 [Elusimicrobia bacterium]|nr:hypothetical protein [Elusimicrobiota bacterium]
MRRVPSLDFSLGSAFHKVLAGVLSLALVLGPASAFSYDDDRYTYTPPRVQNYQNQYKPQNNFSPSFQLDRQIGNQNAAMQLRFGSRPGFVPSSFSLSTLNQPTLPQPKFQFADLNRTSLPEFKINLPKPQAATKPESKGFFGTMGAGLKAVGNAFKGFAQAVGNAIAKVFTIDRAKISYDARRDQILKTNPEIKEIAKGQFQVADGQQFKHGGTTWEPGSTFQMNDNGRGIHLTQGVTMSPDLGGIKRADGKPLPVVMTLDNDRFTPTGIDYSRIEPRTKFDYTHPVTITGLGAIPAGASMIYEGTKPGTKADLTPVIMLSFQNARIDNPGKALESITNLKNEKITLTQMEVRLKGRINEINGLHLNRGNETLFVSQHGETFSVSQLEQKTAKAQEASAILTQQSRKLSQDSQSAVLHSNTLFNKLHQNTATPNALDFEIKSAIAEQSALTQALDQKSAELNNHLSNGNYSEVASAITTLEQAQTELKANIATLQAQTEQFQAYKRAVKGLEMDYGKMAPHATPESMKTPTITVDQLKNAAGYFTEEKKAITQEAQNAFAALQGMADRGILTPQQARLKCAEIMLIRNHLLAAKPDVVGNAVIKTADTMEQGYELLNLAADKAVFNHLDKLAESHPGVTLAIGRGGLAAAGGAAIVGVGYGLATAPATTAVVIGSGVVSQKTFEAMGLSPRAAAVYSAIVVAPVAAAATTSSSMKAINSNIVGSVRGFFVGVVRFLRSEREAFTNPATGQAGHFTIGSNKKTVVIGENMDDRVVPYARENDFSYRRSPGKPGQTQLGFLGASIDQMEAQKWLGSDTPKSRS